MPGIKVDKGLEVINDQNETITKGLEDLDVRCKEYDEMGAKFTKWRSVINIGDSIPSDECINQNIWIFLRNTQRLHKIIIWYQLLSTKVLINGVHDIHEAHEVSTACLSVLFEELEKKNVLIEGCILKPSMVTPGMV